MNRHIPLLALIATFFLTAAAYAAPELAVEQGVYNFGTVSQGKKVQHTFTIKNTGDAPLQIRQLKASCGCTAASPSSSQVAPGKTAEIRVVFDSTNFSGRVQKSVAMETNAGRTPIYTFVMDGTVTEELQFSPRTVSLGAIKIGTTRMVTISVANRGSNPVRLLTINSTTPQIKGTIKKGEIKPGDTGSIEVNITPQNEAKVLSGYLHVTTDSPQKKEVTIPVYASPTR